MQLPPAGSKFSCGMWAATGAGMCSGTGLLHWLPGLLYRLGVIAQPNTWLKGCPPPPRGGDSGDSMGVIFWHVFYLHEQCEGWSQQADWHRSCGCCEPCCTTRLSLGFAQALPPYLGLFVGLVAPAEGSSVQQLTEVRGAVRATSQVFPGVHGCQWKKHPSVMPFLPWSHRP